MPGAKWYGFAAHGEAAHGLEALLSVRLRCIRTLGLRQTESGWSHFLEQHIGLGLFALLEFLERNGHVRHVEHIGFALGLFRKQLVGIERHSLRHALELFRFCFRLDRTQRLDLVDDVDNNVVEHRHQQHDRQHQHRHDLEQLDQ